MERKSNESVKKFFCNEWCMGFSELKDNCWNYSITSVNPNNKAFINEYLAGFVQGKLQGQEMLQASRNNTWDNAYLCNAAHTYPKQLGPTPSELLKAEAVLIKNYRSLLKWIYTTDRHEMAQNILRLLYRMFGIYDGAVCKNPQYNDLEARILQKEESAVSFQLGYGKCALSLGDVYFINAQMDLFDVVSNSLESTFGQHKSDHCSAFLKRTENDIYWTHNSWCGYLSQSHTITYLIRNDNSDEDERKNVDFITQNSYCPGQFGSNMDFGFNGHGICFNETTHRYAYNKSQETGVWLCWRAAAAEMFAQSIEDFYNYITIDNTGTYLNGYMLIDVNRNETALIEMSYQRFVLFHSKDGNDYTVTEEVWECDGAGNARIKRHALCKDDYNPDLLNREFIFGVNYPIAYSVANDLLSRDNRPKRRIQFRERIGLVNDIESAKALITYVDESEPLSIYGRWDLGYGNAGGYSKTIPDGAVDSKAFSALAVKNLLNSLQFQPNENSTKSSFWMVYGTAEIDGKPFVWSDSDWKECKKDPNVDFVPDKLQGAWNETMLFMD